MLPGKQYAADDVMRMVRKRWWLVVLPALVGLLGGAAYAWQLPNLYRSETFIMVTPQQIPDSYVRTATTRRIEDRLASLQQEILSRSRLERVIADFNLYTQQRREMPMEDVVEVMRRDITTRATRGDVFELSYVSTSARSAKEVTERLASMFIDENLRNRMATADSTSQFLQAQLEDTRKKLEEIEQRRATFRQQYMGELPEQVTSNLAVLNSTQMRAQSLTDANAADAIRKATLERQIAELTMPVPGAASSGSGAEYDAGSLAAMSPTAMQLSQAEQALAQARLRLRDDHPDMQRLKTSIEELRLKLDQESAQRPISPTARTAGGAPDPRSIRVAELRKEIDSVNAAISGRERELSRLNGVLNQFQSRMRTSPALENQLMQIERDYATFRKQYDDLLSKARSAEMAAGVEQRQIGEQFRIVDAARVPERPFSPNRVQVLALGLLGGLAVGLGIIALIEYRDSSFHTIDDVVSVLALPVVAAIPVIQTQAERRRSRRRKFATSMAAAIVVLGGVTILFVRYGL